MKNVMVDLETLGTVPGCAILSIGGVRFDATGLGEEFYVVVSRKSCADAGLHEDPDTLAWWKKQSPAAQEVLRQAGLKKTSTELAGALTQFTGFCKGVPSTKVWGNGADFDNPILAVAYFAVGLRQGWGNWSGRCYRTVKDMLPGDKLERQGTHHNALDDAKSQALHQIALWKRSAKYLNPL